MKKPMTKPTRQEQRQIKREIAKDTGMAISTVAFALNTLIEALKTKEVIAEEDLQKAVDKLREKFTK
jgi:ketosteroid isomerase-like protein